MADYQSLLTRAVANLAPGSAASARQAIYTRARNALVTQLRGLRPPLPESDITREEEALDRAVAAVEEGFASAEGAAPSEPAGAPPATLAPAAAPALPSPPPRAAAPPPRPAPETPPPAPAASRPQTPPMPPRPSVPPSAGQHAAVVSTAPPASNVRPTPASPSSAIPQRPTAPAALRAPAPTPPRPEGAPPVAPPSASAAEQGRGPKPPPVEVRPPVSAAASAGAAHHAGPPIVAARPEAPAPANLARVAPGAKDATEESNAPAIVASRPRDTEGFETVPEPMVEAERIVPPRPEVEGLRPSAPAAAPEEKKRQSLVWMALAALVGSVLAVAAAAILMRQKPQDLAIAPPSAEQPAPQTPAKIAQRAQPSSATDANTPPAAPQQPAQPPAGQTAAPQGAPEAAPAAGEAAQPASPAGDGQSAETLPSSARAALLIASPDNPQKPVVNLGSTVWSTIPAAPGQPSTVAVKADADIPDLKMHASMILRKNTDPTLQATHTIDLKFTFADGAPFTGFKDVGLPQMRKVDSTASETLTSVKVKISDDYFLIALAKGDTDTARNLDLMQTRAWFDFPLLLNDNRIAKLVFQKSAEGQDMLVKAFEAWK